MNSGLPAPFAILLVFDFPFHRFLVLVHVVVHVLAHATPQSY